MSLREQLQTALKEAMKAKAAERLSTLRLINAAIKDREIALRGEGEGAEVDDAAILAILGKMVKQRQESARIYEEGGRLDFAERELNEIRVIEEFHKTGAMTDFYDPFIPKYRHEGQWYQGLEALTPETAARVEDTR